MSTPFSGIQFTFTQPDGTELWVKGWGNQHHAVFECLNGYTVVKDPITGFYVYAEISPDGEVLLPTGVRPRLPNTKAQNLGIASGLRVTPEAAKAQAMQSPILPGKSRWQERREQVKAALHSAAAAPGIAAAPPTRQTVGYFTGLCLLIQFPDQPAGTITQQEVDDFCNKEGYDGYRNNGSVYDYFFDISGGKLRYKNIVTPYYTAKHPRIYYSNPALPPGTQARELIKEALIHFKAQGFDFTRLTSDNQNYVYAISAFYAGWCPNNWNYGLWPHQWYQLLPYELAPGKLAYDYQITAMTSELSLGTFCHENGHMICDFPDLYDYGNESAGIGNFCLMCSGNHANQKNPTHVNPYLKYKAGWTQVTGIAAGLNATIQAGKNQIFIHRNASNPTEYFIIENRDQAGRDQALPGSGLAIWHIDEWGSNQYEQRNAAFHYECSLVQADGRHDLENDPRNYGDASDLFGGGVIDHFGDATNPKSKWWDGTASGLDINAISAAGTVMTFKATFIYSATLQQDDKDKHYLRPDHNKNKAADPNLPTYRAGDILTGDKIWKATKENQGKEWKVSEQNEGDMWLHVTMLNGTPINKTCWIDIVHKGKIISTLTPPAESLG